MKADKGGEDLCHVVLLLQERGDEGPEEHAQGALAENRIPFLLLRGRAHDRGGCRCQNRRISGRGSRTVRLRLMVTGGWGHDVYPGSGPLDGGNTLLPA